MLVALFVSALVLQEAPRPTPAAPTAPAGAAQAANTPQAVPREEEGQRMVCRRERLVGSNRPQRICMTSAEWQQARDTSREVAERMNRQQPQALPLMR